FTGVQGSKGIPNFFVLGQVDGLGVAYYDSTTLELSPTQDWMCQAVEPSYFRSKRQELLGYKEGFQRIMGRLLERYNQTGVHTLQLRVGCSLRDDSPQAGVLQYAYDSQDFIGFDGQRGLWVAAVQPAVLSKRRWEADRPWCQFLQHYLQQECRWDWCEKMLPHSLTSCLRPVPPEVSVSCRDAPDGSVTLSCHARGFYPRPIHVSWVRDEEDILAETDSSGILPNADSTYYTQSSLEISLQQDGHRYACREGGLSPCALLPPFPLPGKKGLLPPGVLVPLVLAMLAGAGPRAAGGSDGGSLPGQTPPIPLQ
uniref:Ig-like domain-containing protein n=1 Tax=Chrysemys picta bellii TaxID=8478 RepID=A0A8C3F9Y2_CHRPI